jgi:hypothetical protein
VRAQGTLEVTPRAAEPDERLIRHWHASHHTNFCMDTISQGEPRAVVSRPECLPATFRGGRGNNRASRAAGTSSRRLQYFFKNLVDLGGSLGISVKSASAGNCHRTNALAPEVARHQSVHDGATFAFNSRRLHQPSLDDHVKAARRGLWRRRADTVITSYAGQAVTLMRLARRHHQLRRKAHEVRADTRRPSIASLRTSVTSRYCSPA